MSIKNDIHAKLPDNNSGQITPNILRQAFDLLRADDTASIEYVDGVIINTFSGTVEPNIALGKEGDIYKRYPSDTPVVVMDEASNAGYDANGTFYVFDDPSSTDLTRVLIGASVSALVLIYGANGAPDEHDYQLQIGSGTVHDLTVIGGNATSVQLSYDAAAAIDVAGITTSSNVRIASAQLTGKFQDYTKYSGAWFPTIPYSRTEVTTAFSVETPSKVEMVIAFNEADHHDWQHDHKFYVNNAHGLYIITYRSNGDTNDAGTNYKFYWEKLVEVV